MKRAEPASSRSDQSQPTSFLFLASHGVLSPLSAIRWGCNRLGHTAGELSTEQQSIVSHIEHNAALLSRVLQSLLLLARLEEHVHAFSPKPLALLPTLRKESNEWQRLQNGSVTLECDEHVQVHADETPLAHVCQNMFSVFLEERAEGKTLKVECIVEDKAVRVRLEGRMQAPFIQYVQTIQFDENIRSVVGGTPGLFLAATQGILDHMGGTLEMRETPEGLYEVEATLPQATLD